MLDQVLDHPGLMKNRGKAWWKKPEIHESRSKILARNGQVLGFPQHQAHQPLNYFAILTCGLPIVPLKIVIKSWPGLAIPSLDPTQKMIHGLLHVMLPCRKLSEVACFTALSAVSGFRFDLRKVTPLRVDETPSPGTIWGQNRTCHFGPRKHE